MLIAHHVKKHRLSCQLQNTTASLELQLSCCPLTITDQHQHSDELYSTDILTNAGKYAICTFAQDVLNYVLQLAFEEVQ